MIVKSYTERWGHPRTKKAQGSSERKRRRAEAQVRQAKWDALTTEAKIAVLLNRPGLCKKQLTRLGWSHGEKQAI